MGLDGGTAEVGRLEASDSIFLLQMHTLEETQSHQAFLTGLTRRIGSACLVLDILLVGRC